MLQVNLLANVPLRGASLRSRRSQSVSVVIPTRNRPSIVVMAVRSALAQTLPPKEVFVVIDGPDGSDGQATVQALSAVRDARLHVLALPRTVGGCEARNAGVRAASGEWIAFLDDDDTWLPEKLAVQMAAAAGLPAEMVPVLSCDVIAQGPHWQEVWPREQYRPERPLAEYLFCRGQGLAGRRYGRALLQTSTLVAPRTLLLQCPFAPGLARHQDWDWLLRVVREPGVVVCAVGGEPLAVFHVEGDRASTSRVRDWRFSLTWALERKHLFTPRALAAFIATECAAQAETAGWRERALLVRALLGTGAPAAAELPNLLLFLGMPRSLRCACRDRLRARLRPAQMSEAVG